MIMFGVCGYDVYLCDGERVVCAIGGTSLCLCSCGCHMIVVSMLIDWFLFVQFWHKVIILVDLRYKTPYFLDISVSSVVKLHCFSWFLDYR